MYVIVLYVLESLKVELVSLIDQAIDYLGELLNDFFMGRELNPRIGNLDLKFVCELRPGLIGWMLIDWCLCATQLKETGSILPALALVTLFQTIYVLDALKYEVSSIRYYEFEGCLYIFENISLEFFNNVC